jgi:hypothetical protein
MRTKPVPALIAAASTLAVVGLAYATIRDSSGVIHGCYAKKDGSLRVVDTGAGGACDAKIFGHAGHPSRAREVSDASGPFPPHPRYLFAGGL